MSLNYRIIGIFITIFACHLYGGNEVGNGGNAVVCLNRVELLDLYEAKVLRKFEIDPGLSGSDPFQIAAIRLGTLEAMDPKSAKIYKTMLERLKTEISFEDGIQLKPIDDSAHAFEPKEKGCKVSQLAVFRKKNLPGEKIVLVEKTIWKKLTPVHQAGLLLHEIIYKHLSDLGEKDSAKARYLVSYVLSAPFSKKDVEAYWSLVRELRLPIYR
jgi:hypothetical protein